MDLSIDVFLTPDELTEILAFGAEQGARVVHDCFRDGVWRSEELSPGKQFARDVAEIIGNSPRPGTTRFYFLLEPSTSNPFLALDWFKVFVDYGGADELTLYKSRVMARTGHDATAAVARKVQRRLAKMTQPGLVSSGAFCTRGAARLYGSGIQLHDRGLDEIASNEELKLKDLPEDIRGLVVSTVRTLAERGPRGLVEDGLCAPEFEVSMAENRNDYPGRLIDLPSSAELWVVVNGEGTLDIDVPLHDDREGRMDLHIFLEVDPNVRSIKVTGLYTP